MRQICLGFLAVLSVNLSVLASAADYPDHLVRIIVPYPAGGGPDVLARAAADRLFHHLAPANHH